MAEERCVDDPAATAAADDADEVGAGEAAIVDARTAAARKSIEGVLSF
jgi:hypothetical protein